MSVVVGLIEEIVGWLGPVFSGASGYAIIGAAVLLERSIMIGLVVPGDVTLALGGVFAARGDLTLAWVVALGILAAVVGESAGYWLGRRYGVSLIRRLPLANRLADKVHDVEDLFRRHGGKTVAIGRYATAAGAFVPFAAGMGRMRYPRFLAFDVPAIIVWAAAIALVGYLFGENLGFVDRIISRFGYTMLGILLVGVGLYAWKKYRDRERD